MLWGTAVVTGLQVPLVMDLMSASHPPTRLCLSLAAKTAELAALPFLISRKTGIARSQGKEAHRRQLQTLPRRGGAQQVARPG